MIATGWAMLKQREDNRSADFMERIKQVAQFFAAVWHLLPTLSAQIMAKGYA
jgi:hypothetical protein